MKITLSTRLQDWEIGIENVVFCLLPDEYDSSVDAAHSVANHLFGSASMIHYNQEMYPTDS